MLRVLNFVFTYFSTTYKTHSWFFSEDLTKYGLASSYFFVCFFWYRQKNVNVDTGHFSTYCHKQTMIIKY